jgi:PAS domain S-box-containing protein
MSHIEFPENYILSLECSKEGKIKGASEHFYLLTGYTESGLVGKKVESVMADSLPRNLFADINTALKNGSSWNGVVAFSTEGGDLVWGRINFVPAQVNGVLEGFNVIIRPVSEKVVADTQADYKAVDDGRKAIFNSGVYSIGESNKVQGRTAKQSLKTRVATGITSFRLACSPCSIRSNISLKALIKTVALNNQRDISSLSKGIF